MVLTNAERQKRHRERVKAKLAKTRQSETLSPTATDTLIREYRGAVSDWLLNGDDSSDFVARVRAEAVARFEAEPVNADDVAAIVRWAAFGRLTDFFAHIGHGHSGNAGPTEWAKHDEAMKALRNGKS